MTKLCGQEGAPGVRAPGSLATEKQLSGKVNPVSHDLPEKGGSSSIAGSKETEGVRGLGWEGSYWPNSKPEK